MSDYPKYFAKGDVTKVAHNARNAVELKFAGYKETAAPVVGETVPAPPEESILDMLKRPESKNAPVVDTTN